LLCALPDSARSGIVMLRNVDQLANGVRVSWIKNRGSVPRSSTIGAVRDSFWRRYRAGTLPHTSGRGRGEKQRQKQRIQRWTEFDQAKQLRQKNGAESIGRTY
jgi:hypothetical protein